LDFEPARVDLTPAQRVGLLAIARRAIREAVTGLTDPGPPLPLDNLPAGGGAFVTLLRAGKLRGCIGRIEGFGPLAQTVYQVAVSACRDDYRFPPVAPPELAELTIEISILTRAERIQAPDQVRPGIDGLIVTLGQRRGLLLPQVASSYGWDAKTFMDQTCIKAGLDPQAWKRPGVILERFQALVFAEQQPANP
jgi:AmmeMemoRadiSam system protein A